MPVLTLPVRQLAMSVALLAALAGVLASVYLAPTGFAAPTSARVASADVGSTNGYSKAAFQATNTVRRNRDRVVLRGNACLRKAAHRQARAMAESDTLYHQDLGRVLSDCDLGSVGENVAYGYPTGRALVRQGWMRSTGHRDNILRPQYRLMGLAAVKSDTGRWYAAQVFGAR